MTFVHIHASGRYTASPGQVEEAMDDYMAHADMVTVTEVDNNLRARTLREEGWQAVFGNKGPRDDCGLSIRRSKFVLLEGGTQTLSHRVYRTEAGHMSDTTEGAYAVVREKAGVTGVVVVVHMPHGMQEDLRNGGPDDDVAKAYRSILRGARRLANQLARAWRVEWTMIVGDWNLNIRAAWVREFLKEEFPNFHINFSRPYPRQGTFGDGIIDLAMLRGCKAVLGPKVLPQYPGFDHVGWKETLGGWAV